MELPDCQSEYTSMSQFLSVNLFARNTFCKSVLAAELRCTLHSTVADSSSTSTLQRNKRTAVCNFLQQTPAVLSN
jgi:hypothetical protein